MIDLVLLALALFAGGFAVELYSANLSTSGRQEQNGYQLGFEAYHHTES